ncbi:MAG: DASS family sodium-coupled anion symporter [Acidobacteria bacterium]|nr:DASS family sodium-coupled anion symporter [Acidobacteriota bacterium]
MNTAAPPSEELPELPPSLRWGKRVGFWLGLALFGALLWLPTPAGLKVEAHRAAAVVVLMTTWWMSEALPLAVTSMLPLFLFPCLRVLPVEKTSVQYADHYVFLMMGGFFIAQGMQKWNLHRRIALRIISLIGSEPRRLVLGFMVATAFLSLWISNTATAMLMLPITMAVLVQLEGEGYSDRNFGAALVLGVAYAASIGGIGTLVGTFPNVIFAGMARSLFPEAPRIGFLQWMLLGVPVVLVFVPLTWAFLILAFPFRNAGTRGQRAVVERELQALGPMGKGERYVLAIFATTAVLWIFRSNIPLGTFTVPGWSNLLGIERFVHDSSVAIFMSTLMFIIPVDRQRGEFLLDWPFASRIPWGILILFGGGFAIAEAFQTSGLTDWVGAELRGLAEVPVIVMVLGICALVTLLSEVNSNTATAAAFLPLMASLAVAMRVHPFLLMLPTTLAASCGFMLPTATPPNAILFASERVKLSQMARAGLVVDLLGIVLITLLLYFVGLPVFGIQLGEVPAWAQ